MAEQKSTAVALYKASEYAIVAGGGSLNELMSENIGNGTVGDFDLDRIKVPAGGGTQWAVPTLDGVVSNATIEGVVIAWKDVRSYWPISFDEGGGGSPPECSSSDSIIGIGKPGGSCDKCPLSKFDTADKGGGQACRQMRYIFLSTPGSVLPYLLVAPPTSLKNMRQYFLRLASAGVPYYGATTKFSLTNSKSKPSKDGKSKGGITYSQIVPALGHRLDDVATAKFREFGALFRPQIEAAAERAQAEGAS